jgi:hypothetical protein
MGGFSPISFSPGRARDELDDLADLLSTDDDLGERSHILPFFQKNVQAAAAIGKLGKLAKPDLVAFEYDLLGDFRADIVVGDSEVGAVVFIELENAASNSIFKNKGRTNSHWAPRFKTGVHQLIDWSFVLDQEYTTTRLINDFGDKRPDVLPILLIGRTATLDTKERDRLDWYRQEVGVNGKQVWAMTFDDVLRWLQRALSLEAQE